MDNFCTLFDSFYLSRGLAMYQSLSDHSTGFHLFIFAFDELSFKILTDLGLERATVIPLRDFETAGLLNIKNGRTRAEYCWTCTPSVIYHVLKHYNVVECTYLDSDLYFYSDPSILLKELNYRNKNVLITLHRFSFLPRLYEEKRSGRFCVQFMTFRNEEDSMKVLDIWRKQCIEWCYARHEEGKFGDQKYLDEWPETYSNVHILENPGGGIAPWNLTSYVFSENGTGISGVDKSSRNVFSVVFFHFQYVKFLRDGSFDIGWYFISSKVKKIFYLKYITKLLCIEKNIKEKFPEYNTGFSSFRTGGIRESLKNILKKRFGYNIVKQTS